MRWLVRKKWLLAAALLIFLFLRPQAAVDGAQSAMRTWYLGVAPALLPFLALMPMLTGSEAAAAYRRIFSKPMRFCFGLSGEAVPAVVASMLSGSPGGAVTTARLHVSGAISSQDAARISLAIAGVSPAYLILSFHDASVGIKLAAIQVIVQLLLLKSLENVEFSLNPPTELQASVTGNSVRTAVEITLSVCGYMAVFGACGRVAAAFLGEKFGGMLLCALDLPSGMAWIAQRSFIGEGLALGAVLGFGGVCIAMQNLEKLRCIGVRMREYFAVRLISASLTALLCALFLPVSAETVHPDAAAIYQFCLLAAALCALPALLVLSRSVKVHS